MKKYLYIFLSNLFLVISIIFGIIFIYNELCYLAWVYNQQPSLIRGLLAVVYLAYNPFLTLPNFFTVILELASVVITYYIYKYFDERIDKQVGENMAETKNINNISFRDYCFKKIDGNEYALEIIKLVSIAFYVIAGLSIIIGFILMNKAIIDGMIFGTLALLLHIFKSRIIAILLFIFCLTNIMAIGYNIFAGRQVGLSIILSPLFILFSYRTMQATFYLNKKV